MYKFFRGDRSRPSVLMCLSDLLPPSFPFPLMEGVFVCLWFSRASGFFYVSIIFLLLGIRRGGRLCVCVSIVLWWYHSFIYSNGDPLTFSGGRKGVVYSSKSVVDRHGMSKETKSKEKG